MYDAITGITNSSSLVMNPNTEKQTFSLFFDITDEEVIFTNNLQNLFGDTEEPTWIYSDLKDIAIIQSSQQIEQMELDRMENIDLYDPPMSGVESIFSTGFRDFCLNASGDDFMNYFLEADYRSSLKPPVEFKLHELLKFTCNHTANIAQKFTKAVQFYCWQHGISIEDPYIYTFPGDFVRHYRSTTVYASNVTITTNPDNNRTPNPSIDAIIRSDELIKCSL